MMVRAGFSLAEVRQLYSDEFLSFYQETVFILENEGMVAEGTYDTLVGTDAVSSLRKQLRNMKRKK